MHGGAEACLAAADVFLARPGLAALVELAEGARARCGVIRRNIALLASRYNVARRRRWRSPGCINPLIAAILMPASSLTVVLGSWYGTPLHAAARACMSVLFIVLPLALMVVGAAVGAFVWAARRGQFDDLETPAMRMLHDDTE